jgi:uncharacterized protein
MSKNPVVHFEMPYKDSDRLSKFYSQSFGWQMNKLTGEMGNYVLAGTTETDENQMVKTPGTINGGFFEYKDEDGYKMPSVVISVDDLKESIEKVEAAGGEVLGEPMDIPGIGTYVAIHDTEGNRVGMLQPVPAS